MTVSRHQIDGRSERMQRTTAAKLTAGQTQLTQVKELAEVLRSLHELLLSYAPPWYTRDTDERVRKALAKADSALSSASDVKAKGADHFPGNTAA